MFLMQVVIFCGGKGTRMDEKSREIPKHLLHIGDKPILWHVMKIYSHYGHKEFILCLGYLGNMIKEYFSKPENREPDWKIEFVDTGLDSMKSERLKKVEPYIKGDTFLLAYGDDVSDVDISKVIRLHKDKKAVVTLTAVHETSAFGVMDIDKGSMITKFTEKPVLKHWVNGGFYVVDKKVFGYIRPKMEFEVEVFNELVRDKKIAAYEHDGFWLSMNTQKDFQILNELWKNGAPWAVWKK
ncbi:MAG: sugar phosphate nucleotidyltransferase [Candidatus Aenigmatarchaeota archaeon]